eukprot:PhM_4_TR4641/c0_g1_i1/m.94531
MASKTQKQKQKKKRMAAEGISPSEPTKAKPLAEKNTRKNLRKYQKYAIGHACAYDIYEEFERKQQSTSGAVGDNVCPKCNHPSRVKGYCVKCATGSGHTAGAAPPAASQVPKVAVKKD